MSTAGLIYLAICAGWLAYLVPTWLRRHDRAAHEAGMAAALPARRVLTRSLDVDRSEDRADGGGMSVAVDPAEDAEVADVVPSPSSAALRTARRVAAARRRRMLGFLILCVLTVNGLAAAKVLQWWAVAIPAAAVVVFFVVARTQVRRQQRPSVPKANVDADAIPGTDAEHTEQIRRVDLSGREAVSHRSDHEDAEETIEVTGRVLVNATPNTMPVASVEDAAIAPGLWDPVTVTLPTYVYKAKATPRTVRTVDLAGDGVFSSASERSKESKQLLDEQPAKPAAAAQSDEEETVEVRRAVGD